MKTISSLLLALAAALLLSSCAGGPVALPGPGLLERADESVRAGHYTSAYLSYRTAWSTASNEAGKQEAARRARLSPSVVAAGAKDLALEMRAAIAGAEGEAARRAANNKLGTWDYQNLLSFHRLVDPSFSTEWLIEEAMREPAEKHKEGAELQEIVANHLKAQRAAKWPCKGTLQCEKAFAIAQIFVNEHSSMKIQVATNTIVETFNPTENGKVGLRIVKLPLKADEAEIRLTVTCKSSSPASHTACLSIETLVYLAFPIYLENRVQQ